MLTLELEVPKDRASLAIATLHDGDKILMSDFAAASATPSIAAVHGNPSCDARLPCGHPPLGTYFLIGRARNTGAPQAEYGGDQFVFYSKTGSTPRGAREARKAGLHGRRGLLAYGGALGADNGMRRTQGGIRLPDKMIAAIYKQLLLQPQMKLTLRQRTWWAFWRPHGNAPPLSATEPQAIKAPDDEMTLLAQLLHRFIREPARSGATPNTRESRREDSSSSSSSDRTSSSSSDSFRGQGGQSAGGGASGGWGGADGNSRVAAGAAVGAAAALVVGAAVGSEADYTTIASPFSDSSHGSDGGWTGGSSDSSSSSSGSDSSSSSSSDSGGSDSGGGGSDSGGGGGGD